MGYTITLYSDASTNKADMEIHFAENRSSDDIVVYWGEVLRHYNREKALEQYKTFVESEYTEVVDYIVDLINKFFEN